MKYSLPPFNEKEQREFFEQKINDFSMSLFNIKIIGIIISTLLNILYLYLCFKKRSTFAIIFYLFIIYSTIVMITTKIFNLKEKGEIKEESISESNKNKIIKELIGFIRYTWDSIKKAFSFKDKLYTIRIIIEVFLLIKILPILGAKFILFIVLNIIVLYAPLDKKCPHFLFQFRMSFRQIIEGILGILLCLIPLNEKKTKKD